MVTLAIFGEVTPGAILTKCGLWGDMVDVITCAIFRDCRLRGVGVVRAVSLPSLIDLTCCPYNAGHTTAWSCDYICMTFIVIEVCLYIRCQMKCLFDLSVTSDTVGLVLMWTGEVLMIVAECVGCCCDVLQEQGDVQSSVQESLALLVGCFTDVDAARLAQLEALVLQNIEQVMS